MNEPKAQSPRVVGAWYLLSTLALVACVVFVLWWYRHQWPVMLAGVVAALAATARGAYGAKLDDARKAAEQLTETVH